MHVHHTGEGFVEGAALTGTSLRYQWLEDWRVETIDPTAAGQSRRGVSSDPDCGRGCSKDVYCFLLFQTAVQDLHIYDIRLYFTFSDHTQIL